MRSSTSRARRATRPRTAIIVISSETDGPQQVGGPLEADAGVVVTKKRLVLARDEGDGAVLFVPTALVEGDWEAATPGEREVTEAELTTTGLGPLRIGDTYAEVADRAGLPVRVTDPLGTNGACLEVSIPDDPGEVTTLGSDGTVRAIELADRAVKSKSGLGIGSIEAKVDAAFPGRITRRPRADGQPGSDLVFTPEFLDDRLVIFQTDGAAVTGFRVGEPTWTPFSKTCS